MMWDEVLERIVDVVTTDDILVGIFGESMRMAGTGEHGNPMLEWTVIADSQTELWAPCVIQFDQWTPTLEDVVTSERRLRALFDHDMDVIYGGLKMRCKYIDGSVLATPDRDGFNGRAIRFRFEPLRRKYASVTS